MIYSYLNDVPSVSALQYFFYFTKLRFS